MQFVIYKMHSCTLFTRVSHYLCGCSELSFSKYVREEIYIQRSDLFKVTGLENVDVVEGKELAGPVYLGTLALPLTK